MISECKLSKQADYKGPPVCCFYSEITAFVSNFLNSCFLTMILDYPLREKMDA
jgi:hypothetical protein